jgi:hypothetical protein
MGCGGSVPVHPAPEGRAENSQPTTNGSAETSRQEKVQPQSAEFWRRRTLTLQAELDSTRSELADAVINIKGQHEQIVKLTQEKVALQTELDSRKAEHADGLTMGCGGNVPVHPAPEGRAENPHSAPNGRAETSRQEKVQPQSAEFWRRRTLTLQAELDTTRSELADAVINIKGQHEQIVKLTQEKVALQTELDSRKAEHANGRTETHAPRMNPLPPSTRRPSRLRALPPRRPRPSTPGHLGEAASSSNT